MEIMYEQLLFTSKFASQWQRHEHNEYMHQPKHSQEALLSRGRCNLAMVGKWQETQNGDTGGSCGEKGWFKNESRIGEESIILV